MSRILLPAEGTAFGAWIFLGPGNSAQRWVCVCICGTVREMPKYNVWNGQSKSCGCLHWLGSNRKHGQAVLGAETQVYIAWKNIKARCLNPKSSSYHNYGARGVTMAPEWVNDFKAFADYIGPSPGRGYRGWSVERLKNSKNYEPGNVAWRTRKEQSLNTRRNHLITMDDVTKPLTAWCAVTGVNPRLANSRINSLGWDPIRAITEPARKFKRKFK